jgi:hypothetical protein
MIYALPQFCLTMVGQRVVKRRARKAQSCRYQIDEDCPCISCQRTSTDKHKFDCYCDEPYGGKKVRPDVKCFVVQTPNRLCSVEVQPRVSPWAIKYSEGLVGVRRPRHSLRTNLLQNRKIVQDQILSEPMHQRQELSSCSSWRGRLGTRAQRTRLAWSALSTVDTSYKRFGGL